MASAKEDQSINKSLLAKGNEFMTLGFAADGEGRDGSEMVVDGIIEFLSLLKDNELKNDLPFQVALLMQCQKYMEYLLNKVKGKLGTTNNGESGVKLQQNVRNDACDNAGFSPVEWCNIIGHGRAKTVLREAIVWPLLHPQFFNKIPNHRDTWSGILLFGPSGTSKTCLIMAAVTEAKCHFRKIKVGEIMSRYLGESEKIVTEMFDSSISNAPSVIFIDEIDSLMSSRSKGDSEDTSRIKSHILDEMNRLKGVHVVLVGATNLPGEIDSAFKRRFEKRIYIPLPTLEERVDIFRLYTGKGKSDLKEKDFRKLASCSEGFSGSDIQNICKEASLVQVRDAITKFEKEDKPLEVFNKLGDCTCTTYKDIRDSLIRTKPTTSAIDVLKFERISRKFSSDVLQN